MFEDRRDAGRRLAEVLRDRLGGFGDAVVLGLPRGGVVVADEVAEILGLPLDVVVVRKLGAPGNEEYAMGAIGEGGVRVLDDRVLGILGVTDEQLARVEQRELAELERRATAYRSGREPLDLEGTTAIVVDDGIATGSTAAAACRAIRRHGARRIVLAMPVAPPDWRHRLRAEADEFLAIDEPDPFFAVGAFYRDFAQTTDDEVTSALSRP